MARYILVQVDSNKTSKTLRLKLDLLTGVKVIALWAKPVNMCECKPRSPNSPRGRLLGWACCPQCKLPKSGTQHPRNLLDDPEMGSKFTQVFLSITEPFTSAVEKFGEEIIERDKENTQDYAARRMRGTDGAEARREARRRRRRELKAHPRRGV